MIKLSTFLLAIGSVASITKAAQGVATLKNARRFMFDVDGNQMDVVAVHASCMVSEQVFLPS